MYERCVDDLVRFVSELGEAWFKRFSELDALLNAKDSPLKDMQRELLVAASSGKIDPANEAVSFKLLGIK